MAHGKKLSKKEHCRQESYRLRPPEPHHGRRGVSPRFRALLEAHDWKGKRVLDIGCGTGAATVLLAKLGALATGIDIDPLPLMDAQGRAKQAGINARFLCADAELADLQDLGGGPPLGGVVAHLCFSKAIAKRAAKALAPGGVFIVRAFHRDMWKEAGGSPHAGYTPTGIRKLLRIEGFEVKCVEVERRTQRFKSFADFDAQFMSDAERRKQWEEDGRLARVKKHFERGNHELTEAFILFDARRA